MSVFDQGNLEFLLNLYTTYSVRQDEGGPSNGAVFSSYESVCPMHGDYTSQIYWEFLDEPWFYPP